MRRLKTIFRRPQDQAVRDARTEALVQALIAQRMR